MNKDCPGCQRLGNHDEDCPHEPDPARRNKPRVVADGEGGYTVWIGDSGLVFSKTDIEKLERATEPGCRSFILLTDMIDRRTVEVLEVGGLLYTKTDLREAIASGRLAHKQPEVPL